jgi:hypothetical protein
MPQIELPDGHRVALPEGEPIGSILPPEAIVARFDGALVTCRSSRSATGRWNP